MDLNCSHPSPMMHRAPLKLSPDGYIRLPFSTFSSLPFVHLFTEQDDGLQDELLEQAILTESAGFSECITNTTPSISLGWAWYMHGESNCLLLAPEPVRSNVMIIDMHGYDVGPNVTSDLISHWLQFCDWQTMVRAALRTGSGQMRSTMRIN